MAYQVILVHRDVSTRFCVNTDALGLIWSDIITLVPSKDLPKAGVDQLCQPLAFLSAHLTGPQLSWSILEKKAFAIMDTIERMSWILATSDGFNLL